MLRAALFLIALQASAAGALAARDCPIDPPDHQKIEKAIEAEATCKGAFELMNACRYNASGDVSFANIVIAKCERSFVTRGQSPRMKAYEEERAACRRKYAKKEGTMYVSFAATCEAGVAVKYAR